MNPAVALSAVLALAAVPLAAADHTGCGTPDGNLTVVLVWLEPGCVGAVVPIPTGTCQGHLHHGTTAGLILAVSPCGVGAWIP